MYGPRRAPTLFTLGLALTALACGGEKTPGASASNAAPAATVAAAQPGQGEKIYTQRCMSCHQMNGAGSPGVYPALAGSEYAINTNPAVPANIVIHGLQGPITVKGEQFNSLMPAYGIGITMSDEEVAAVVTYIRTSWGNAASAVTAAEVAAAREASKAHVGAMTAEALKPMLTK
ncbi:MAG: c-type cytochrome [Gemmatimonadaceae bacterium]